MAKSKIEWTEKTWNPIVGCTKISTGCDNCDAESMALRLQAMNSPKYKDGFEIRIHPECFDEPMRWKKPSTIFVCSMSDFFHSKIDPSYRNQLFMKTIAETKHHTYLILTKRARRMRRRMNFYAGGLVEQKLGHVWFGVTIEDNQYCYRADELRATRCAHRFLSLEPLLGKVPDLNLNGIDWVIVGGESGPSGRLMDYEWVAPIRDQCIEKEIPFFFKQWGGVNKKQNGRMLNGQEWSETPEGISLVKP